jgi:hypothetical protein
VIVDSGEESDVRVVPLITRLDGDSAALHLLDQLREIGDTEVQMLPMPGPRRLGIGALMNRPPMPTTPIGPSAERVS